MKLKKLVSFLLILALALLPMGCWNTNKKSKTDSFSAKVTLKTKRPGVGGFYMNAFGGLDSLPSLKAHASMLNEVYPLWYHVRADGTLKEEPRPEAIAFAKQNKIKIIPLINVVSNQDAVLLNPAVRDAAVRNIIRVVQKNNYDGVNIDFEFIPSSGKKDFSVDRTQMTAFMKMLNTELKKLNKLTHMSVLPHVGVPNEMAGVYDYRALSPIVDKVTLMCYDHSQEGSPPGPLAPFSWVEQNVTTAIKQGFKPSQICLGVATYGYDWPAGKAGGFSNPSKKLLQDATMKGYKVHWSDKNQEPYYTYTSPEGIQREVWFENHASLQTKINLVNKYKLTGICIWRLGFEDQQFWQTIQKNWGKKK